MIFAMKHMGMGQKACTPGEHQNSWDLWMFIPLKMVCIGIDSIAIYQTPSEKKKFFLEQKPIQMVSTERSHRQAIHPWRLLLGHW